MLVGDFLILLVTDILVFMAISSIFNYKKYKSNISAGLESIGSSVSILKKS